MIENAKYTTRFYPYYGYIPQIVRSNTLEMAKKAIGVAKIWWDMSFVLQSLWCENNTDKTIRQDYLYTMQTFEYENQKASLNPIVFKDDKFANATHYTFDIATHISMSHLIHIHNNKIDIFLKDKSLLDIHELESIIANYKNEYKDSTLTIESLHSLNTQIFFYSIL